ncbi:hypothetical protein [Streptomyces sp. 5-10]|uniref:hypothetical protein n=1 Tax=Streptomyces sp. 5-10 TaxID=878925 RepID=UPI00168BAD88|nr:hypothetical protein [Streptomyces sp. 5-10]MBD3004719.1 hypothetical protein [Streptomyces sp. 5-10]
MCSSCGTSPCIPTVPGPHVPRTKDVHGIPDTSKLETKTGAQKKADQAANKALTEARQYADQKLKDIDAPDMSQYETKSGAQGRVDEHAGKTRDVHGIPDTSKLITEDEVGPLVDAAVADAVADLDIPSGGGDGKTWETPEGAQAKVDEHAEKTKDVHGIPDTAQLVTKDELKDAIDKIPSGGGGTPTPGPDPEPGDWETPKGAQDKADKALDEAKKYTDEHAGKTKDVHGIKDTAQLVTKPELKAVEDKIGDGGGGKGGVTKEEVTKLIADELAKFPSAYAENDDNIDLDSAEWTSLDPKVEVTVAVPPSGKVEATTCFTARNAATRPEGKKIQTYQALEIKLGDKVLLKPSDSQAVTLSADSPGDPSSACHSMIVDLVKLGAKVGDKVTVTAVNRKGDTPEDPAKGAVSTILDRNITVLSLVGGEGASGGGGGEPKPEPQPGGGLTEKQVQEIVDKAVKDALDKHIENCHTLDIIEKGVTPEQGWKVDVQELRQMGGVSTAFIRLERTGDDIASKGPDFKSEGKPSQGNIVPDLLIAKLDQTWCPPQSLVVSCGTSYGSGTVRVEKGGGVYLLDWTYNNPLRKGHLLRTSYEFMAESKCQGKEGAPAGDGKPGPGDGGQGGGGGTPEPGGTPSGGSIKDVDLEAPESPEEPEVKPLLPASETRSLKVSLPPATKEKGEKP